MITFGLDAELFFIEYNDSLNKVCVPAVDILKETIKTEHGLITLDGSAVEINPFHVTEDNLIKLIEEVRGLRYKLSNWAWINHELSVRTPTTVGEGRWHKTNIILKPANTEFKPVYKPSFNAWSGTEEFNKFKENSLEEWKTTSLRSGGCHIHIGNTDPSAAQSLKDNAINIVRLLDYYVGGYFVILTGQDKDEFYRRDFYGRAGSYRIQSHGIEYRVMSNTLLEYESLMESSLTRIREIISWFYRNNSTEITRLVEIISKILSGDALQTYINSGYNSISAVPKIMQIFEIINKKIKE